MKYININEIVIRIKFYLYNMREKITYDFVCDFLKQEGLEIVSS